MIWAKKSTFVSHLFLPFLLYILESPLRIHCRPPFPTRTDAKNRMKGVKLYSINYRIYHWEFLGLLFNDDLIHYEVRTGQCATGSAMGPTLQILWAGMHTLWMEVI